MNGRYNPQSGFSLTEIAIVVIVGGILLMLVGTGAVALMAGAKLEKTKKTLAEVNEAVQVYAEQNSRLPCAASRVRPYLHAQYGREVTCSGPRGGTVTTPGFVSGNVRIGFLPTRELGLPDELGYDAWGSRLIYAVTEELTDPDTYDLSSGSIRIDDSNGIEITTNSNATYAIFSLGPDRRGGYNSNGDLMIPCNEMAASVDMGNCDDLDGRFVTTVAMSDTQTTARHYDDLLVYESDFQPNIVPPGAIMAFDLDTCPTGWTPFAEASGRMVIGQTPNTRPIKDISPPPFKTGTADDKHTYAHGEVGGWHSRFSDQSSPKRINNMPPYAVYLYCSKNGVIN